MNFFCFKVKALQRAHPIPTYAQWWGQNQPQIICPPYHAAQVQGVRIVSGGRKRARVAKQKALMHLVNKIQNPMFGLEDYRYFDSYIKQNNSNSTYGNEANRTFSRNISFSLRQHNDKKGKLHVEGLNTLIKPRSCSELNESLEIKNETGIFIKVGCIKTNEKKIATRMERQRWILFGVLLCEYVLKVLCLCLGSAVQVLKEWNMTGKKKVRLILIVN